jgi:hypothetical protein
MSAPKGNLNALKNGFYSRLFRTGESNDILQAEPGELEHEITLLRVMIRRTMELAEGIDDLKEASRALDALGAAASRLAGLLRTQKHLREKDATYSEEISIAIREMNEELRRKYGP